MGCRRVGRACRVPGYLVGALAAACVATFGVPRTHGLRVVSREQSDGKSMADYCKLNAGLSWSDFREKGFTVAPGFLPEADRAVLLDIYGSLYDDSVTNPGGNGGHKAGYRSMWLAGKRAMDFVPNLIQKVLEITAEAGREVGVNISDPYVEEIFFTTNSSDPSRSLMFGWHQDLENYFFFQDLPNYMNFYIFLKKPDPREAGVTLVPWDAVLAQSPELQRLTTSSTGVFNFMDIADGRMIATDATQDTSYLLNFHLDQMSCSPEIRAGDMLLFAGNTIHRTQAHQSWRISLNLGVHQDIKSGPISIAELLRGGLTKYSFMVQNARTYVNLHKTRLMSGGVTAASDFKESALDLFLNSAISIGFQYHRVLAPIRYVVGSFL